MHPHTLFSKTAKGVLEVKNRTIRLPRALGLVFLAVDGKTRVAELPEKARKYLQRVADLLEVPIGLISLGPKRHQTIMLEM